MGLRGLPAAAALLLAAATGRSQEAPPSAGGALEELDRASCAIVDRCGPAVARVDAERPVHLRLLVDDPSARRNLEELLRGVGAHENVSASGFLVDGEGLVLTASAVAGGAPTSIRISFPGRGAREGTLVGEDPVSGVALVRVAPLEGVRPLDLAGGTARAGALTLLLAPAAEAPTLRLGFVTDPCRAFGAYDAWLVSSSAVSPGHAGAPLLDARGDVLGMHVAARETVNLLHPAPLPGATPAARTLEELADRRVRMERGAPFATFIPARELRRIVAELRERGVVRRGMAGVRIGRERAVVAGVLAGGPADGAGLREGDLVLSVDGVEVRSGEAFGGFVGRRPPGSRVRLRLRAPDGAEREATLVLGELPLPERRPALFNGLGVAASAKAPDLSASTFSTEAVEGGQWVLVASVEPGSPPSIAGFREGDWMVEIEGEPVLSEADYVRLATTAAAGRREVSVLVYRPGEADRRALILK